MRDQIRVLESRISLSLHPGLYEGVVVKRVIGQGDIVFFLAIGVEREALMMTLRSDGDELSAPGGAAVKAGRRPPPEAARSGLDGGEHGAKLCTRNELVRGLRELA